MKQLIFAVIIAIGLSGCKSQSPTSVKLDQKSERMMDGSWILTSVTTPGSGYIKVNTFELADSKCFEGSTWKFVANNNKGNMALASAASDCPAFSSPISWYRNKNNQFVLKILDAGEKAKKVRDGYVLDVANQTENSFDLIDMVSVGGNNANVTYTFTKQ